MCQEPKEVCSDWVAEVEILANFLILCILSNLFLTQITVFQLSCIWRQSDWEFAWGHKFPCGLLLEKYQLRYKCKTKR